MIKKIKRWFRYKILRFLVSLKSKSVKVLKKIENENVEEMDQVQKLVYSICTKLLHDQKSELISNSIDYTYHIENDNYLVIIRPKFNHYAITLIEFRTRQEINSFDVIFEVAHVKTIVERFDREIQRRMKKNQLLKTTRVSKHLQQILVDVEEKQKI